MTPTEILRHDHEVILAVFQDAGKAARSINAGGPADVDAVARMVDFFRNFADGCHHRKEEQHLFLKMVEHGMPFQQGPIAVMLHEHEEGRRLIAAIADAVDAIKGGDTSASRRLADSLMAYGKLMLCHIEKENQILFPMAESMLTAEEKKSLVEKFHQIDAEGVSSDLREYCERLTSRV